MEEAERIAKEEHGSCKLAVISGKNGDCLAHHFRPCALPRLQVAIPSLLWSLGASFIDPDPGSCGPCHAVMARLKKSFESLNLSPLTGVGTRDYYRRLGYELDGPYMSKMLK